MYAKNTIKDTAMQAGRETAGCCGDIDELRGQLHRMWSGVAGAWGEHAAFIDARGAVVTERMLDLAGPRPGERVLELACGPGGAGLAAAERVGPSGEVVLSDVSPGMVSIARTRAEARGLKNVSARALDLEQIDQPDSSYDIVLCREGLMLVQNPARALGEIRRVLRPGGRVAIAVWGPRTRNPWLDIVFNLVSARLGMPLPLPGGPHPFALSDANQLTKLMSGAGLADAAVEELSTPYRAQSPTEWWERTRALAGPLAQKLAALPADIQQALRTHACETVLAFDTPTGLVIPGVSLLASARRA